MSYKQFQRFKNFEWLTKDQLTLANEYICKMFDEDFEYYYDMHCFAMKCFCVYKKSNNVRIGFTLCNNEIVNFLLDDKHENCQCCSSLKIKINSI